MPSQAGSAGTGTYIVFSQPAGVPGQSRQAGGFQGRGWGGVASWATCPPLLLQELSCCRRPFPSCGAGSGSGWKMRPKAVPGAEGGRLGLELGT